MIETTRYRLYTEDTRNTLEAQTDLDRWISVTFPRGVTIYGAEGVWYGGHEYSMVIEVITDEHTDEEMLAIAKELRDFNKQEAVLLTRDSITAQFI